MSTSLAHPVRTKTFSTHVTSKLIYVVRKTGLFTHASNESLSPATRQASPAPLPRPLAGRGHAMAQNSVDSQWVTKKRRGNVAFFWLRFHALSKMISVYQRVTKSPVAASRRPPRSNPIISTPASGRVRSSELSLRRQHRPRLQNPCARYRQELPWQAGSQAHAA